jgi:hypothetical protein
MPVFSIHATFCIDGARLMLSPKSDTTPHSVHVPILRTDPETAVSRPCRID